MIIVVTGSRHEKNAIFIHTVLNQFHHCINRLYIGDAKGVDSHALWWAKIHKKEYTLFEADWDRFGNSAGPIRNKIMLEDAKGQSKMFPLIVLAFPGGTGTNNCVMQAKKLNLTVLRVEKNT